MERERLVTDERLSRTEKERTEAERSFGDLEKENQEMINQIELLQGRLAETEEKAERKYVIFFKSIFTLYIIV